MENEINEITESEFTDTLDERGNIVKRVYNTGYTAWCYYSEDGKRIGFKDTNGLTWGVVQDNV